MNWQITQADASNVHEVGIYCIKNKKAPGYQKKLDWFTDQMNQGLEIQIAVDDNDTQLGFIEYLPAEQTWRPVHAPGFLFIHCIAIFAKAAKNQQVGSGLIQAAVARAKALGKQGICAMSSKGSWMASQSVFQKNGFVQVDQKDRYELMSLAFYVEAESPQFIDWTAQQAQYQGWHLVYSDQCPWHEKAVGALQETAGLLGISLTIQRLATPAEAQQAPSGFGTFALLKDGQLLADHYISATRFRNIVKKAKS
ncbi:MAG: GNAT family N-acetyltransferase [Bacteroidota bacterium]